MPDAKQEGARPSKLMSALKIGASGVGGVVVGVIVENSTSIFGPAAGRVGAALEWFLFDTMPAPPWLLVLLALAGVAWAGVLLRGLYELVRRLRPRSVPWGEHPGSAYVEDVLDTPGFGLPPLHLVWTWYSSKEPNLQRTICAAHGSALVYWSWNGNTIRGCSKCGQSMDKPDSVQMRLEASRNALETEIARRANCEEWRDAVKRVKKAKMERNSHG